MIETLLIANRGEIAGRIARTCRQLGIRSVAVYTADESSACHVREADEALLLPAVAGPEAYLDMAAIIAAARRCGADAVHPGYGFLAENAAFGQACAAADLIFVGPSPGSIAAMGDKSSAKLMLAKQGIPVIPGYEGGDQSDTALRQAAGQLGYPLMVKAAEGGGGKGMRLVVQPDELDDALQSARREARRAFGSERLILECVVAEARHIEFQVFGDQHGHLIHLGERECTLQRRYQKVIEESPSLALSPELRQRMGETAVAVARAIQYTNAGTVEFLLDQDNQFYFLEMNTRLQVEHPVTEGVIGQDLVEWQIRIAEGEPLPLTQDEVRLCGHAIEARLYAEDPANAFLPVSGRVQLWRPAEGFGVRVDSGVQSGDEVALKYDPLLAKVIVTGKDRKTARRKLLRALEETVLLGITSNQAFLRDLLRDPGVIAGQFHTGYIGQQMAAWRPVVDERTGPIALTLVQLAGQQAPGQTGYWRNNPNQPQRFRFHQAGNAEPLEVAVSSAAAAGGDYQLTINDQPYLAQIEPLADQDWLVTIDGYRQPVSIVRDEDAWWVHTRQGDFCWASAAELAPPQPSIAAVGSLRAPMPGSVLEVLVQVGQPVTKGQPLVKLEAMKMEHTIRAAAAGVVEAIYFSPGDTVSADEQLLQLGPLVE